VTDGGVLRLLGVETQAVNPHCMNSTADGHQICIDEVVPNNGHVDGGDTVVIKGSGWSYGEVSTNGLIAYYDGVNNTGTGEHSTATTTWKNLAPAEVTSRFPDLTMCQVKNAATCGAGAIGTNLYWDDNSAVFGSNTSSWFKTGYSYDNPDGFTLEAVVKRTAAASDEEGIVENYQAGGFGLYYSNTGGECGAGAACFGVGFYSSASANSYSYTDGLVPQVNKMYSYSAGYEKKSATSECNIFISDQGATSLHTKNIWQNTHNINRCAYHSPGNSTNWAVGTNPNGDSAENNFLKNANLYSIRVYSRRLSNAELDQNYAADKGRYLAAPTVTIGGQPCTSLEIQSADTLVCKTPAHAAGSVDVAVNYEGVSPTLANGYTYWQPHINSIAPSSGPESGGQQIAINGTDFPYATAHDYIQDGLVLHFDGIDNAGVGDNAHISTTTTWRNLAPGAVNHDADLCKEGNTNCTEKEVWTNATAHDDISPTAWGPKSLDFDGNTGVTGNSYVTGAIIRNSSHQQLVSGNNWTLEASFKGYKSRNTSSGSMINSTQGGGIGLAETGSSPWNNIKAEAMIGGSYRNHVMPYDIGAVNTVSSSYNGTYFNSFMNGKKSSLKYAGNVQYTSTNAPFVIGEDAADVGMESGYPFNGKVFSVRIYNRPLTNAEVIQNSTTDKRRFTAPPKIYIGTSITVDQQTGAVTGTNAECTDLIVGSTKRITCKTGSGLSAGLKNVYLVYNNKVIQTLTSAYTVVANSAFYISSTSPAQGPKYAAGQVLTLTGNKMNTITAVTVGGANCPSAGTANNTTYTCTIPAGAVGLKDIRITYTDAGTKTQTLTGAFEYLDASTDPVKYRVQRSAGLVSGTHYEYSLVGASGDGSGGLEVEPAWTGISAVTLTYPSGLTTAAATTAPEGWTATGPTDAQAGYKTLTLTANTLQTSDAVAAMLKGLVWTAQAGVNITGTIKAQLTNGLW
jgi:hypothetical protein